MHKINMIFAEILVKFQQIFFAYILAELIDFLGIFCYYCLALCRVFLQKALRL